MVGIEGSGKTTSTVKLARFFQKKGFKTALVCADTYRPGAYDQLKQLADKYHFTIFGDENATDAIKIANEGVQRFKKERYDIIIVDTAGRHKEERSLMKEITKKKYYDPIFLIDLAIPRDIDPEIEDFDNIYLYNLDDLNGIVEKNLEKRRLEIPKASRIIDEFLREFEKWVSTNSLTNIIGKLKKHLENISENEMNRIRKRFPENGYQEELDNYTQNIINKLVRQHMKSLKKNIGDPEKYKQHIDLIYSLYEIDVEK